MGRDALKQLASFAPALRSGSLTFVQFIPPEGDGSDDAPYVLGTGQEILTNEGNRFVESVYAAGWVLKDFDWSAWAQTSEGAALLDNSTGLAHATEEQISRTLTALFRKDRFAEGTLAEAFQNGTMLSICERAEKLL
jgi:Family of unknown function (DUF6508)